MEIRQAVPRDIDAVMGLGLEALEQNAYPHLVISPPRMREVATLCISGAGNQCLVAEVDGEVVASVAALIHDCMFYERKQATVVQFYSRKPGAGAPLMRAFLRWARSRPIIKMIVFTLEYDADPRIGTMLERMGLRHQLPVYLETR